MATFTYNAGSTKWTEWTGKPVDMDDTTTVIVECPDEPVPELDIDAVITEARQASVDAYETYPIDVNAKAQVSRPTMAFNPRIRGPPVVLPASCGSLLCCTRGTRLTTGALLHFRSREQRTLDRIL